MRKVRQTQQDRDRFEYVLYFRFTLSLDDDYSWLLYLVGISTGSVIIFRLLPFVFFSSQFVWRCDCWGQPFSSCPCQRDLWWMHLGQTCPNNCTYSIYDSIHFKSILFICTPSCLSLFTAQPIWCTCIHCSGALWRRKSQAYLQSWCRLCYCDKPLTLGLWITHKDERLSCSLVWSWYNNCKPLLEVWSNNGLLYTLCVFCRLGDERISVTCYGTYLTSYCNDWGQIGPCWVMNHFIYSMWKDIASCGTAA